MDNISRRELFKSLARGAALTALASLGWAGTRGKSPATEGECVNAGVCRGCPQVEICVRPGALMLRGYGEPGNAGK